MINLSMFTLKLRITTLVILLDLLSMLENIDTKGADRG